MNVGLIAPFSDGSAASSVAIQRGMLLAMDEVNQAGGVLSRPLELVVRDVVNDPPSGETALHDLVRQHQIVAVFGGIYSPVMLRQLDTVHRLRLPLISAWGSVTAITQNGRSPNFAFRTGVSDAVANEFMARYALEIVGVRRPGILVDTTDWGNSNLAGLDQWLSRLGAAPAGAERFDQGDTNMTRQLQRLRAGGADSLVMAANTAEGASIVRGLATLGWRVPVVSHWGVSGGQFVRLAGSEHAEGVLALQTFSFYGELSPKARAVLQAYHRRFGTRRIDEVQAPVGVAHGYDGVHLLARAIRRAGTLDGDRMRAALEQPDAYDGLIKRYDPAFTAARHDPLTAEDCLMAVWQSGRLIPASPPRLPRRSP